MKNLIESRKLPPLRSREEMLDLMIENVYGHLPPKPTSISFDVKKNVVENFCAGKATCNLVTAKCTIGEKIFSFPFYACVLNGKTKQPFLIHVNFCGGETNKYQPTEELIDNGFAVFSFDYQDVTSDNGDFTNGLAGFIYPDGIRHNPSDPGKIALWAWAAQRVMDYAETLGDVLDFDHSVICGHSRLGKTALYAGATDERFKFTYSNESGCTGAAISREKVGEWVGRICNRYYFWFCEKYQSFADKESEMPFDQHYIVASIAPRKVLVGSAKEDSWADPVSEQLCCFAASSAFEKGFDCPDREAEAGEEFLSGDIGYHLREGLHYFSRLDWQKLIKFVNLH